MKKIIVIWLVIFAFVMSNVESKAQCTNCVVPWVCHQFNISVGSCQGILVTMCVYCDLSSNKTRIQIIEIFGICSGISEDDVWDAANSHIWSNIETYCGNQPCVGQSISTVYITHPVCGDRSWDGTKLKISENRVSCDLRCTKVYEWCYCDCDPTNCWHDDCRYIYVGVKVFTETDDPFLTGNGVCPKHEKEAIGQDAWTEYCVKIYECERDK